MRSVYIQKDKTIFRVSEMPAEEFAASLGLPGAPQIKFGDKRGTMKVKERGLQKEEDKSVALDIEIGASSDENEDENEDEEEAEESEEEEIAPSDPDEEVLGDDQGDQGDLEDEAIVSCRGI